MLKEHLPMVVGAIIVLAFLYAAYEFTVIRAPALGIIALCAAVVVAIIVGMRLRPTSKTPP
jgi:hypothetical protein